MPVDRDLAVRLLQLMWMSRFIDEKCKALHAAGVAVPNFHSGTGQEALAVGTGVALADEDYLLYNYRDFGALLAKGVSLRQLVSDLLLRVGGTTRGYGGIMHVVAHDRGIVGRNGVFGSRFGLAVGLGLASTHRRTGSAVACMFGEAEASRAPLYEALNLACLWRLPVVFIAENNGFAVSTRTEAMFATGNMADLWRGFPLPVTRIDGNDVEGVYAAVQAALQHARGGLGPVFIEARTYRIDPHHLHDDDSLYRSLEEVDSRRKDDPLRRVEMALAERGILSRAEIAGVTERARRAVHDAFEEAMNDEEPGPDTLREFVYWRDVVRTP